MLNFDFPFCSITDIYEPIYIYIQKVIIDVQVKYKRNNK